MGRRVKAAIAAGAGALASLCAQPAAAQHYEGCFVGGRQVSDAECGAGGGGSAAGSAAMGMAGSLGYAIGAGIGSAIRNLIMEDAANGAASHDLNNQGVALADQGRKAEAAALFARAVTLDPSNDVAFGNYLVTQAQLEYQAGNFAKARELAIEAIRYDGGPVDIAKHDLTVYEQAIAAQNQAAADQTQRQFAADQQDLLSQMRPVSATPVKSATSTDPKPVYRDADTPRTFPNLANASDAERAAHDLNEAGTAQAQAGDWKGALKTFENALNQDDLGSPFRWVIQENIAIARKHLAAANSAKNPAATPAKSPDSQRVERVIEPHCDQFSWQADGSYLRVCADKLGHHYCEQAQQPDAQGAAVTRVACQ